MTGAMLGLFGLGGGELVLILLVLIVLGGCVAVGLALAVVFVVRSRNKAPSPTNSPSTIEAKPAVNFPTAAPASEHTNMAGSRFHHVNLAGADFDDVSLSNARFHNVDLSNIVITAAQMGGAAFKHVGHPPDSESKQERQRPVRFEEMMLCDSTFRKVDLSNVRILDCDLTGMTIDGILVTDLLTVYQRHLAPGQQPT